MVEDNNKITKAIYGRDNFAHSKHYLQIVQPMFNWSGYEKNYKEWCNNQYVKRKVGYGGVMSAVKTLALQVNKQILEEGCTEKN